MADKLTPNDSRVTHHTTTVNSRTFHYLLAEPQSSPPAGTILLLHGWPDLAFGWRYQIPYLARQLNLRVITPDLTGYGRSSAPDDLSAYSTKTVATDCLAIVDEVLAGAGAEKQPIFVGGHDWGGFLAWRVALWFPSRVRAVFSVCTPYAPPSPDYHSLEDVVKALPSFGYQLHLAGPEVESVVDGGGREGLRAFLRGMYGGRGPAGELLFDPAKGLNLECLGRLGPSPFLSAAETDLYVDEFARNGSLRGPLNWYRTRRVNYDEELELVRQGHDGRIRTPAMIITARKDSALPPAMSRGMDVHFDGLVRREVDANHWALWEASQEVNAHIGEFIGGVLEGKKIRASL